MLLIAALFLLLGKFSTLLSVHVLLIEGTSDINGLVVLLIEGTSDINGLVVLLFEGTSDINRLVGSSCPNPLTVNRWIMLEPCSQVLQLQSLIFCGAVIMSCMIFRIGFIGLLGSYF